MKAYETAEKYDLIRKESGKKNWVPGNGEFIEDKFLPPLFGIPISIKDVFGVEGTATTVGLLSRA